MYSNPISNLLNPQMGMFKDKMAKLQKPNVPKMTKQNKQSNPSVSAMQRRLSK